MPLSPQDFSRLASSQQRDERWQAALNKACPVHLLVQLVHDADALVCFAARRNPALPEDVLDALVTEVEAAAAAGLLTVTAPVPLGAAPDFLLSITHLAHSPRLSGAQLMRLHRAAAHLVDSAILFHEKCPEALLWEYAEGSVSTQEVAASNRCITTPIAEYLLTFGSGRIRTMVARNRAVEVSLLERHAVEETLVTVLQALVPRLGGSVRQQVLERLAASSVAAVSRRMVAEQSTNPNLLLEVCLDDRASIRAAAAANAATPEEGKVLVALQRP